MNLIKFIENFPDETACIKKFKEIRDHEGVTCRKCGSKNHYWQQSIMQFQCKQCGTRTTLRSGTILQASKLPYRYWFITIHLMTSTKKSFSALELQRQIGHKYYEPIWFMMQKIRQTMGIRDGKYPINKIVELDEGFFESVDTDKTSEERKSEKRKRGRGSQKQSPVMVMASTVHDFTSVKHHKKPTKFRYVRMVVMENLRGETVDEIIKHNVDYDSVIKTDKYTSYANIKENVWTHLPEKPATKDTEKALPWVHTMISNAKRSLLGIHHMVSKKYIQNYLNEFCYKVNRRYYGEKLFDRLLIACVSYQYRNLVNVYR